VAIRYCIAGDLLLFRWRFAIDCADDSPSLVLAARFECVDVSLAKARAKALAKALVKALAKALAKALTKALAKVLA
jgi:hypothetical protein